MYEQYTGNIMVDYKSLFYKSFADSNFGVEIEGCGVFYPVIESCNLKGPVGDLHRNICYLNTLIKNDPFPKLINNDGTITKQFTFADTTGYHAGHDRTDNWIYEKDLSVHCPKTVHGAKLDMIGHKKMIGTTSAEIVSPILHMGRDGVNSIHVPLLNLGNKRWNDLQSDATRFTYFEGLFMLTLYSSLLFNNEKGFSGRLYKSAPNPNTGALSTGLHMHYSNNSMKNNAEGRCAFLYALINLVCFEGLFLSFLDPSRSNNFYSKVYKESKQYMMKYFFNDKAWGESGDMGAKNGNYFYDCLSGTTFLDRLIKLYDGIHDRYYSINLTHASGQFSGRQLEPIHIEFRLHHGSIYTKEIHHWTAFLNCFMASCITKTRKIFDNNLNTPGDKILDMKKLLIDFDTPMLQANNMVNNDIIKLLFTEFVPEQELCNYYVNKINLYGEAKTSGFIKFVPPIVPVDKSIQLVFTPWYGMSTGNALTPAALNKMAEGSSLSIISETFGKEFVDEYIASTGAQQTGGINNNYFLSKYKKYGEKIKKLEKIMQSV